MLPSMIRDERLMLGLSKGCTLDLSSISLFLAALTTSLGGCRPSGTLGCAVSHPEPQYDVCGSLILTKEERTSVLVDDDAGVLFVAGAAATAVDDKTGTLSPTATARPGPAVGNGGKKDGT